MINDSKIINRIGMFDFFKGLGMIAIVFFHTFHQIPYSASILNLGIVSIYGLSAEIVIPAFFIVSGYGFRKMPDKKCLCQQGRYMLIPYLYTFFGTILLHLITRFLLTHSIRSSIYATIRVMVGFLLALPANKVIAGGKFYSCGPMWYIIALYIAWIILNYLMNIVEEKYQCVAVLLCALLGWGIGIIGINYFCLSQGLIAVVFLYIGYFVKKYHIFSSKDLGKYQIIFLFCALINIIAVGYTRRFDNVADSIWNLGFISIISDGLLAFLLLYFVLQLNGKNFYGKTLICTIGRYSLYIFAAHTIEMHGIPWYVFNENMRNHPLVAMCMVFIIRSSIILIIVNVILLFKKFRKRV